MVNNATTTTTYTGQPDAPRYLTPAQETALQRHAAALDTTPEDALSQLLYAPPRRRPWTPAEDRLIRNPANAPADIQRQLPHRTVHAISVRRTRLLAQRADGDACPAPSLEES